MSTEPVDNSVGKFLNRTFFPEKYGPLTHWLKNRQYCKYLFLHDN
jgi:hypothetical protein